MRAAVLISVMGKALEAMTLVLLITLVPRQLGPADYGTFAVALSIVTLGSAASALGGPTWLSRFVPTVAAADRPGLARALAVRSARWRIGVCVAAAALATALAVVRPDRFSATACFLVVLALVFDVAATLVYQVGLALGRVALWSLRYPVQNAVLVSAVLALHAGFGTEGALAGIALSSGCALALGLVVVVPLLRGAARTATIPADAARFALVYGASGLFVQLLHRGGVVVVALLAGSQVEAGFAALSIGVALALTYVVWQAFAVDLPRLSAGGVTSAPADASIRRLAWLALTVAVPVAAIAAITLDRIVPALAGERYRGVEPSLGPALAIVPLAALTSATTQVSALRLRPLPRLLAAAVGALVFVAASVAFVPGARCGRRRDGAPARDGGDGCRRRSCLPRSPRVEIRDRLVRSRRLRARNRGLDVTPSEPPIPEVTVIVPTRDRPEALARCLDALGSLQGRPYEIIVADDGSRESGRIAELVAAERLARLLRREGNGPGAARNAAVRDARGAYVCFTDDDCEPAPDWAESLARRLESGSTIVGGMTANGRPESSYVTAAEWIRRHLEEFTRARHPGHGFLATNNLACRRELALELPFDEAYGAGGEDRDWCARAVAAGHELGFEPAAVVRHFPSLDLRSFWRQHVRYGRGAYRFHHERPPGDREHLQPASFYVLLVRGGFRAGFHPGLLVVLAQVATTVGFVREAWSARAS